MTITLTYQNAISVNSRDFKVYSMNADDCEFERRCYGEAFTGNLIENPLGYRRIVGIDFEPLQDDKEALFFLFAWCTAKIKRITYFINADCLFVDQEQATGTSTVTVSYLKTDLSFLHDKNAFFANSFTIEAIESRTSFIIDDGSTKILKPVYGPAGVGIDGGTFTCYVNLVDQSSIEIHKYPVKYLRGDPETLDFGYRHLLSIDTGAIIDPVQREWLRDFCLWKNKKIDTTGIDPYNGKVFDVVCADEKLAWQFINGVEGAKTTHLLFKEKNLRLTIEQYTRPPSSQRKFTLDTDQFDDSTVQIG